MPLETRHAKSGEISIAYQVVGDGPPDLVFVPGFISHLDLQWADPRIARFLNRLASFSRQLLASMKHQRRHANAGQHLADVGRRSHRQNRPRHLRCGSGSLKDPPPDPVSLALKGWRQHPERAAFAPMVDEIDYALESIYPTLAARAVIRIQCAARTSAMHSSSEAGAATGSDSHGDVH